ncbi:MAG: ABC transporter substrate-binding protein, partial [Gammaproteobacteria bacterium]|nr:ABC transporter substrate-binding protein [Gammaproteobacteria bacterium]
MLRCITSVVLSFLFIISGASFALEPIHGIAMHGELKYPLGFKHFDYVNPLAPKGGKIKLAAIGTFDSLNPFILKGQAADGIGRLFDTLLVSSDDEAFSEYGLIAESMEVPDDRSKVIFNLRKQARFHDGSAVTAEDVAFTFNQLKTKGHPFYRSYYGSVKEAVVHNLHRIEFVFDVKGNRELPLIVGQLPILSKSSFADRPFEKTTLDPLVGSGPYKVKKIDAGRSITYVRN